MPLEGEGLGRELGRVAAETIFVVEDARGWRGSVMFTDVGATAYYVKAIPWELEDTSVDRYHDALFELQARVDRGEPLRFFAGCSWLRARKPVR